MRSLHFAFCVLATVSIGGCGAAKLPSVESAAKHDAPAAKLLFEAEGHTLRVAVVRAKVGGVPTLAMVDTGAGRHVVSASFARKARLDIVDVEGENRDVSGRAWPISIADAEIEVDGIGKLPPLPPVVLDMPSEFDGMGIGLILSPQRAAAEGESADIDYRSGELSFIPDGEMVESGLAARDRWPEPARCDSRERSGPLFFVGGKIDGESVSLTIDTGADATCVFGEAPIARVLRDRYVTTMEPALAAGGPIILRRTPKIPVRVGKIISLQTLPILPRESHGTCGQDGHLGLDVLRKCTIVINREHAEVQCPT